MRITKRKNCHNRDANFLKKALLHFYYYSFCHSLVKPRHKTM